MWFARLFGGRRDREEDYEEPTAAPPVIMPVVEKTAPSHRPTKAKVAKTAKPGGFDPYNSGSFERRNAWERIARR